MDVLLGKDCDHYPRPLSESSDDALGEELARRRNVRKQRRCDYCGGTNVEDPCKYWERHAKGIRPRSKIALDTSRTVQLERERKWDYRSDPYV